MLGWNSKHVGFWMQNLSQRDLSVYLRTGLYGALCLLQVDEIRRDCLSSVYQLSCTSTGIPLHYGCEISECVRVFWVLRYLLHTRGTHSNQLQVGSPAEHCCTHDGTSTAAGVWCRPWSGYGASCECLPLIRCDAKCLESRYKLIQPHSMTL